MHSHEHYVNDHFDGHIVQIALKHTHIEIIFDGYDFSRFSGRAISAQECPPQFIAFFTIFIDL